MRPSSQLILFSNSFSPSIDSWFSGNIIFEYDLDNEEIKDDDLHRVIWFAQEAKQIRCTKVTAVLNYNESAVIFAAMSGQFEYIAKITDKDNYDKLRLFFITARKLADSRLSYLASKSQLDAAIYYLKSNTSPELNYAIDNIKHSSDEILNAYDTFRSEIFSEFDKTFTATT
jgi:hypothetical protein